MVFYSLRSVLGLYSCIAYRNTQTLICSTFYVQKMPINMSPPYRARSQHSTSTDGDRYFLLIVGTMNPSRSKAPYKLRTAHFKKRGT